MPTASRMVPAPFRSSATANGLASVLVFVLVLAGTGSAFAKAQGDAGGELQGAYAVSISEEDVPLSLIGSAALQGAWTVRFNDDGSYTIERQDVGLVVMGSFSVEADEVTITDESGLLSCTNEQPIGVTGPTATYVWQKAGDPLTLESSDDTCATRQVLLSTRALAPFIACRTVAVDLTAGATTPPAEEEDTELGRGLEALRQAQNAAATPDAGTPVAGDGSPTAGVSTPSAAAEIGTAAEPEEAISDLVSQLNACWATGDPARVIPLFSDAFIDGATGGGAASLDDLAEQLRQFQTATIMWELAGDIEVDGDEATAVLAASVGGEETLQTFAFVREEDAWRLDNLGE